MLFYNLHILKVPDIVELKTAIIMFKAFHNSVSAYMNQFIQPDRNVVLQKKYARTSLKNMCIYVKGVKLWNALDSSLISCRSIHQFNKYYTDKVLNSYVLCS